MPTNDFDAVLAGATPKIKKVFKRMGLSPQDSDDLLQVASLLAFKAFPSFNGKSSFYTWFYRIALNSVFSWRVKERLRATEALEPLARTERKFSFQVKRPFQPDRLLLAKELGEQIQVAQAGLSRRQRQAFELCTIQGERQREAAGLIGVNGDSIKIYLHYATKKVRAHLKEVRG